MVRPLRLFSPQRERPGGDWASGLIVSARDACRRLSKERAPVCHGGKVKPAGSKGCLAGPLA